MRNKPKENWGVGAPYEQYVGRWSRPVAREFLDWLAVAAGGAWVDVGCGTGALVEGILTRCAPQSVLGIDRSAGFITAARQQIVDGVGAAIAHRSPGLKSFYLRYAGLPTQHRLKQRLLGRLRSPAR